VSIFHDVQTITRITLKEDHLVPAVVASHNLTRQRLDLIAGQVAEE